MHAFVFQSILTVPVFDSALIYLIGIGVSFFTAAGLTVVFGYDDKKVPTDSQPISEGVLIKWGNKWAIWVMFAD